MKRFIAAIDGQPGVNIPADRMEITDGGTAVLAYAGLSLVGVVNMDCLMEAHMSERGGSGNADGDGSN